MFHFLQWWLAAQISEDPVFPGRVWAVSAPGLQVSRQHKCHRAADPSFIFCSRVLLLGASGVGKSSLCCQFLSSENVNTYETETLARVEKCVVMSVNGEESNICFVDHPHGDQEVGSSPSPSINMIITYMTTNIMFVWNQVDVLLERHSPDAVVVVMAVDDFSSYLLAQNIIEKLSRYTVINILIHSKLSFCHN